MYPVDLELIVRAIYEGPDDIEAYFHWKYLQESLPQSYRGLVTTFSVRARTPHDVPRIAQAVDEQFRNAPQPTRTETEKAFMLSFIGMIGNIGNHCCPVKSRIESIGWGHRGIRFGSRMAGVPVKGAFFRIA